MAREGSMASYNKVILVGNLTRDPEVRYTTGGTAVAEIGLAVNRSWTDRGSNERKEETTFIEYFEGKDQLYQRYHPH